MEIMTDTYLTLSKPAEGKLVEQRSRFLSFAYPVSSEAEVDALVKGLRRSYHDARHVCYAYRLADGDRFRANDDGEPSGTAGRPILGQIDSCGLKNVLVVVVRYFGGIKLGTSGLTLAYKTVTAETLAAAETIQHTICATLRLRFDYAEMNDVMRILRAQSSTVLEQGYEGVGCVMSVSIPMLQKESLIAALLKVSGLSLVEA